MLPRFAWYREFFFHFVGFFSAIITKWYFITVFAVASEKRVPSGLSPSPDLWSRRRNPASPSPRYFLRCRAEQDHFFAMRLVCVTEDWARKYQEICEHRNLGYIPWVSPKGLFVAEGPELVAGVMVYDTTGPFLFFEHLVTNQTATLRQRWAAVDMMASEVLVMCRHSGKLPQIIVRHKGIARILAKYGLRPTGAQSFTCEINNLETHDYQKPQYASEYSRCVPDSTTPQRLPPGDAEDHP